MTAALLFAAFVAGLLVLAPPMMGPTERGPNRAAMLDAAQRVETALQWPGLASFLDAAAYTESRWHPTAGAKRVGTNGAIGGWQTRPTSAFPTQGKRKEFTKPQAIAMGGKLLDPRVAAAAIGAYLYRLRSWNPDATWGELRAGMVFPFMVKGRPTDPEKAARFDTAQDRFRTALAESRVELDPDAHANFPAAPAPFVSELAAEIGAPIK